MTDRDRLIELKRQAINYAQEKADERGGLVCIDDEVDYLLASGVILPPCKVGDTIYRLVRDGEAYKIVDCFDVASFEIDKDGIWIVDDMENYFDLDDIGRSIFLNEKEAELALKAKQQKK